MNDNNDTNGMGAVFWVVLGVVITAIFAFLSVVGIAMGAQ